MRLISRLLIVCFICGAFVAGQLKAQTPLDAAIRAGSESADLCLKQANASAAPQFSGDRRAFFIECIHDNINDKKGNLFVDMQNSSLRLTAYYFGKREWLERFKVGGGYLSKEDANVIYSWFNVAFAMIRNDSGLTFEAFCNLTNHVDCSKLLRQFIQLDEHR